MCLSFIIYLKKILDSDWLRGVQFYFKLHYMQCKLTKQEQRLEMSRKSIVFEKRIVFEKLTRACFFPNCTRNHTITYTNYTTLFSI